MKRLQNTNLKVLNHRLSINAAVEAAAAAATAAPKLNHPAASTSHESCEGNHFRRAVEELVLKWSAHRTVTAALLEMDGRADRMTGWWDDVKMCGDRRREALTGVWTNREID